MAAGCVDPTCMLWGRWGGNVSRVMPRNGLKGGAEGLTQDHPANKMLNQDLKPGHLPCWPAVVLLGMSLGTSPSGAQ